MGVSKTSPPPSGTGVGNSARCREIGTKRVGAMSGLRTLGGWGSQPPFHPPLQPRWAQSRVFFRPENPGRTRVFTRQAQVGGSMGRPSFSPTADQRQEVAILFQTRVALEEIARRLGITKKTLCKHFAAELGRATATPHREKTSRRVITRCCIVRSPVGRPVFQATAVHRRRVEVLVAAGFAQPAIAAALDVALKTLRKHFRSELTHAGTRRSDDG